MLFEVLVPMSLLVTIVLFGVLAPAVVAGGDPVAIAGVYSFTSYSQHLINTLCL